MCGRTSFSYSADQLISTTKAVPLYDSTVDFQASYNVKPTHTQPILIYNHPQNNLAFKVAKWGIKLGESNLLINARHDSIDAGKTMYKGLRDKNRCVILAEGYYEWKEPEQKATKKQPNYITRRNGHLMAFAGLFRHARNKEDMDQYVIVTTESPPNMAKLHTRMPFILCDQESMDMWLNVKSCPYMGDDKGESLLNRLMFKTLDLVDAKSDEDVGKVATASINALFPKSEDQKRHLDLIMWPVGQQVSSLQHHGKECKEPNFNKPVAGAKRSSTSQGGQPQRKITEIFKTKTKE